MKEILTIVLCLISVFSRVDSTEYAVNSKMLNIKTITGAEFKNSVQNPREYYFSEKVSAGVVPHHTTAAELISGFFEACSEKGVYDTIIIISPNHEGDLAGVVTSLSGFNTGSGVYCDTDIINEVCENFDNITLNDERMEAEHSASVLMPYVNYYFPKAKVAPFLVSRTLSMDETLLLAETIENAAKNSEKKVLLLCSIDFSHFLSPEKAALNDIKTKEAILSKDYLQIHNFSNNFVDSPASLIIFLHYLESLGKSLIIIDNTDSSYFLRQRMIETTTYFVLAG